MKGHVSILGGLLVAASLTGCASTVSDAVTTAPGGSVVLDVNREGADWSVNRTTHGELLPGDAFPIVTRENGVATFVVPLGAPTGAYTVVLDGTAENPGTTYEVEVK